MISSTVSMDLLISGWYDPQFQWIFQSHVVGHSCLVPSNTRLSRGWPKLWQCRRMGEGEWRADVWLLQGYDTWHSDEGSASSAENAYSMLELKVFVKDLTYILFKCQASLADSRWLWIPMHRNFVGNWGFCSRNSCHHFLYQIFEVINWRLTVCIFELILRTRRRSGFF